MLCGQSKKHNYKLTVFKYLAVRAELLFYDNVPVNKLGLKREQLTNREYLAADMIEAGNEFGPDTQYGSALIRVGQAEKRYLQFVAMDFFEKNNFPLLIQTIKQY